MASRRAPYDASMILADTPTVDQRSPAPLVLSIITRVTASVPVLSARGGRMRTL